VGLDDQHVCAARPRHPSKNERSNAEAIWTILLEPKTVHPRQGDVDERERLVKSADDEQRDAGYREPTNVLESAEVALPTVDRADGLRAQPERAEQVGAKHKDHVRLKLDDDGERVRDEGDPAGLVGGRKGEANDEGAVGEEGDAGKRDDHGRKDDGQQTHPERVDRKDHEREHPRVFEQGEHEVGGAAVVQPVDLGLVEAGEKETENEPQDHQPVDDGVDDEVGAEVGTDDLQWFADDAVSRACELHVRRLSGVNGCRGSAAASTQGHALRARSSPCILVTRPGSSSSAGRSTATHRCRPEACRGAPRRGCAGL
jgi:hypothetical protein